MSKRRFFFVFRTNGRLTPAIYEDEPPTPTMLKYKTVAYKHELTGRWSDLSLEELMAEYRRLLALDKLPPSNMTPPPAEKEKRRASHEITYHSTGEYWKAYHKARGTARP